MFSGIHGDGRSEHAPEGASDVDVIQLVGASKNLENYLVASWCGVGATVVAV